MTKLPSFSKFKRRSRLYLGRTLRTAGGLRKPCVFMHVPKCGGTSVSEALYATVPLHREIGIIDSPSLRSAMAIQNTGRDDDSYHDEGPNAEAISRVRETLLLMHMSHQARLVHGHFLFSECAWQHFGEKYSYVTILRDPLARTISNYRMDLRTKTFHGDFDEYLASDHGRRQALHKLRYFSGMATVTPEQEAEAMILAKRNMSRFALIGFLEDLDGFARDFARLFGVKPWIPHYNSAGKDKPFHMTDEQRHKLEVLCAPDIELFAHAHAAATNKVPSMLQPGPKEMAA
ncbi:MAG: sulfotransferase family 2 domain-containing protein [Paracoccus sp. (in: a-proteobacteria)]|uniref:sulfotransferase family 2 domain-containing protein n=1 Tax=Paracoccus sp. TaxID=267 RepID=UPI0039E4A18D